MNKKVKIEGKNIFLKSLGKKNATKEYCSWLNNPAVNKYLETREATIAGIEKYIKDKNKNPNCLFLGIFFKENQKHIGTIKLEPVDFKNLKATLGLLIGDQDYWGKGIGKEATALLVDYGFNKLKLKEVNLGVISENKAAIRVYEKVGFKIEKINKKSVRHGKKLFDQIIMSIRNENNKNKK